MDIKSNGRKRYLIMKTTRQLLLHSLVIALVCVVTVSLVVSLAPLGVNGFFNLGDVAVMSFVVVLNKPEFALSSGLGSAMADLLTPYQIYAPYTFVIKALLYLIIYLSLKFIKKPSLRRTVPFIIGGLWIAMAYALTEVILYGSNAFFPGLGANSIQGFSAAIVLILISPAIETLKSRLHFIN